VGVDAKPRGMRPWPAIGALMTVALFLPDAVEAKPKPPPKATVFVVTMDFTQIRDWAYDYSSVGLECSSTIQGNGSDTAILSGKAIFNLNKGRGGFAGIASGGTHRRTGTMTAISGTPNFPGADCGGPPQTTTDPTTGCETKPTFLSSAALHYVGETMALRWDASQSSAPDFPDCPYHAGDILPDDGYHDVNAIGVTRKELLRATKRRPAEASGHSETSATETCETVEGGCAEGVASSSSATLTTEVKYYFWPKKKR
jgi:hypothetical protein